MSCDLSEDSLETCSASFEKTKWTVSQHGWDVLELTENGQLLFFRLGIVHDLFLVVKKKLNGFPHLHKYLETVTDAPHFVPDLSLCSIIFP